VCDIEVVTTSPFNDARTLPSLKDIQSQLKIGSPAVAAFSSGTYTKCTTAECAAASAYVDIYVKGDQWDADTIFQTKHPTQYYFNRRSDVKLGTAFLFRNVPHFISFKNPSQQDVEAEIETLIMMLVKHKNTAPFVSKKLIQHLVTSNPSPRYISAVSTAFREGNYEGIGSGKYGDMSAVVAAILLDQEARVPVLDAAPSFGKIREPRLKLLHLMRTMEFQAGDQGNKEVVLKENLAIGMQPFQSESVFNFYSSDFQPRGALAKAGLYSPEMMLGTAPFLLGFLNGASSLINHGLTNVAKGFHHRAYSAVDPGGNRRDGLGALTWRPSSTDAAGVVAELDVLLTNGRLDDYSRAVMEDAYHERLTVPVPYEFGVDGVVLQLQDNDFKCTYRTCCNDFSIRLQPTVDLGNVGYSRNNGGNFIYFRNGRGGVLELPGVRHFAHNGNGLYLEKDRGANIQKELAAPITCALFESMFNPGDTIEVSLSSMKNPALDALKLAITLMVSSAEFHTSTTNARTLHQRTEPPKITTQGRPYKAIVVLFMSGGVDSWNLLVPTSGCTHQGESFDLFSEYKTERGSAAIASTSVFQAITSPNTTPMNTQPCTGFGINPGLANLHALYNAGDASFIANVGSLVQPLDRDEYRKKQKQFPESLFAHNAQQRSAKSVHAGEKSVSKGVLGRITEALTHQPNPYATAGYSMKGIQSILAGDYPASILGNDVEVLTNELGQTRHIEKLLQARSAGGFAETYSHLLNRSVVDTTELSGILEESSSKPTKFTGTNGNVERQMKNVAKVILARDGTHNEREVFYISMHGFDSHFEVLQPGTNVYGRLQEVDRAVSKFEQEMKAANLWDDVLVVSSSDFGRKLGKHLMLVVSSSEKKKNIKYMWGLLGI